MDFSSVNDGAVFFFRSVSVSDVSKKKRILPLGVFSFPIGFVWRGLKREEAAKTSEYDESGSVSNFKMAFCFAEMPAGDGSAFKKRSG